MGEYYIKFSMCSASQAEGGELEPRNLFNTITLIGSAFIVHYKQANFKMYY